VHLILVVLAVLEAHSREEQMRRLETPLELASVKPRLRAALYAQGVADSGQTLEGALGVEVAVESEACRYVVIGGQARLSTRAGETASSAEQWASVCPFSGMFHLELTHHLEWDVRPSFAAPRIYPRAPYSRERIGVLWRSLDIDLGDGMRFIFADVETEIAVAFAPEQSEMTVRLDFIRFVGTHGGSVDLFRTRVHDVIRGTSTFAMEFAPVALGNVRLGRDDLRLDAEAGFVVGQISLLDEDPMTPPELLVAVTTFSARTRVRGGGDRLSWSGGYVRSIFPTLDGAIALEDRFSASAGHRRGAWTVGAQGFAAVTNLWDATRDHDVGVTGGGELSAGRDLGHGLHAGAFAEIARTYYAELDGTAPTPTLGARALLVLSARIGN
jgi:hypothetical protein